MRSEPVGSTRSSRRSGPPRGRSRASPRVTPSVWSLWTPPQSSASSRRTSGLVALRVPANTYPGQKEDVTTVAATALLVTHGDVPQSEAAPLLKLMFEGPDPRSAQSAQEAKISKRSGLRGIAIPMHPAASQYFGASAPAAPGAPPKAPAAPGAPPKG